MNSFILLDKHNLLKRIGFQTRWTIKPKQSNSVRIVILFLSILLMLHKVNSNHIFIFDRMLSRRTKNSRGRLYE